MSLGRAGTCGSRPIPRTRLELGGAPHLDAVTFAAGEDADALAEEYGTGALDAVVDFPATYEQLYAGMAGTATVASPAIGFHQLGFNCWRSPRSKGDPLLRDPSIRRAVHWAIDERQIAATAMAGLAEPATSLLSPAQADWRWEVPEAAQYRYDPQRAKQILEDAGYADRDGDGVREDAAGDELSFRLVAFDEYPEDQIAARMIVGWCRDVGIRLRLESMDEQRLQRRDPGRRRLRPLRLELGRRHRPRASSLSTFTAPQIMGWSDSQYSTRTTTASSSAGGGAGSRAPGGSRPAQGLHRRDAEDPVPRRPLRGPLVQREPAGVPDRQWTGYALAPSGSGAPFWNQLRASYIALRPLQPRHLPAPRHPASGCGRAGRRGGRRPRGGLRAPPPPPRAPEDE